uniref:ATP synthase complex subunit 8 n=1 Tax=Synallactes sp. Y30071 TaxID=2777204 RepID=A0A7M1CF68_9ECHN|nr:ATP synthase F0 subunit 8 [Synallactes sp. Y30071]
MPQLDLSWFIFNFFLAWTLVIILYLIITNQNWSTNNIEEKETNQKNETTTNWTW